MSVQPVGRNTHGVGFAQRHVRVTGYLPERQMLACQEINTQRELAIPALPLRVRLPRVGETWLIEQLGGLWCFTALISSPSIFQTITVASVAPLSPLPDDLWVDTSGTGTIVLKVWSGTAWRAQA